MAIQVLNLPLPAAGKDWLWTVPGQWLPYLYGVQATLKTNLVVATLADETGNGHTLSLPNSNGATFPASGPYAGGANNGAVFIANGTPGLNQYFGATALDLAFGSTLISFDGWWNANTVGANPFFWGDFWGLVGAGASNNFAATAKNDNTSFLNMAFSTAGSNTTVDTVFMSQNAWHHVAWTWDGTDWRVYLDGTFVFLTNAHAPVGRGAVNTLEVGGNGALGRWLGGTSGVAYYNTTLTAGQVAAHAAAGASAATYKAAVLADSPVAYYGLNALPPGVARTVTLVVTDGTHTLGQYPANVSAIDAQGFVWSWQSSLSSTQQSPDGTINSVPIPEIAISSGYTVGTKTLDLAATDQWEQVTLWFDDGTGPGGTGTGPGTVEYLDATLIPETFQGG